VFRGALQPWLAAPRGARENWASTANVVTSVLFAGAHLRARPGLAAATFFLARLRLLPRPLRLDLAGRGAASFL
jgi:hypothetical protein